jgi:hypothetical protein
MAAEPASVRISSMYCEEYKQLLSELDAACGQWIYFRLTADKRAAGITDAQSKEMIRRAKERVDEMKTRLLLHRVNCQICKDGDSGLRVAG